MPIKPIQSSFAGGEYSPSIYPRTDLEKYRTGLRTCRNFVVHPHGGVSNRSGSKYISSTKYSDSMSVAVDFVFNQTQAYTLEFGYKYIRFYTDGAQIQSNGAAYEVTTPYLTADLNDLRFESSADVIWITHPDYQTRTLTRYDNSSWSIATYAPEDGPFMPENTDESTSLSVSAVTGSSVTLTLSATTITDTNVKLLLHGDGVDGSTTMTDSSSFGRAVTANGNAQVDTAITYFGTGAILFDGSGDYLSAADSDDWHFGSGDFTIHFMANFSSLTSNGGFHTFISQDTGSTSDNYFQFLYDNNTHTLVCTTNTGGVPANGVDFSVPFSPSLSTWYHIALVRNGNVWNIYVNGVAGTKTLNTGSYSNAFPNFTGTLQIGRRSYSSSLYFEGSLDEFVVIKGQAKWTADFTIPTAATTVTTVNTGDFEFDSLHVGALFKLEHYIESQTLSLSATSTTTSSSIKCFTTWRLITHGTWTGKFKIEKSTDGGTTWTVLRMFSGANDINIDTSGTEDIETNPEPFLIRINVYSYTSGTLNIDLSSDPFYQVGIVRATAYLTPTTLTAEVLQEVGSTSATITWSEGSWSAYRGYPSVARFYQDRLCFAATDSEPQTIWMSATSDYYSFVRHSTILDTDGITVNLPSRQINKINGLMSFKKLLAFTTSSIWSIGPLNTSALTPTSVLTDIEEYTGSSTVEKVAIGTEAIYIGADNESVRNIGYQLQNDAFNGADVNILAKHLFEGYTITKIAYQRNPNSILWVLRSDGVLLGMTYMKEQEVVAWFHCDTTGTIESICVIPGDYGDELWMTVSRTNGRYMERMYGRKQNSISNLVFMDSYVTTDNSTSVISGLTHLANMSVSILADGTVLDSQTVSALGTVSVGSSYTQTHVGLAYTSDVETLTVDFPTKTGTIQGSLVKIGAVVFRLINTRGGYIGPNSSNLYEAFTYSALNNEYLAQYGTTLSTTSNFTGDLRVPLGASYGNGGRVFYRQTQPLPVGIGAISPELEYGDRSGG